MTRVLVADDHAVVRAGYARFLEFETGVTDVGEAANGDEAFDRLREGWDLLLLDLHMPKSSGLDVLQRIRTHYPELRILVTSGLPEVQYARAVMRAGADGFLSKASGADELAKAVRLVLSGKRYVGAALAQVLAQECAQASGEVLHDRLSNREFQTFCRIAAGSSISRIALDLNLSIKTISTYRSRVLEKLNFQSNADLTSYALRNRLIDL